MCIHTHTPSARARRYTEISTIRDLVAAAAAAKDIAPRRRARRQLVRAHSRGPGVHLAKSKQTRFLSLSSLLVREYSGAYWPLSLFPLKGVQPIFLSRVLSSLLS